MKSRFPLFAALWLTVGLLHGSWAQGQTITGYNPIRVAAGDEVTISGQSFGARRSGHSIKYGRGSAVGGAAAIVSWTDTSWGGTPTSTVRVRLPATIASGTYWLALYESTAKGDRQIARGPETLQVSGTTKPGPKDPDPKDPEPSGFTPAPAVAPFEPEVKISPELSIVSVERTGSGPIQFGDRIPVDVRVRNSSRSSAEVAVGYVGDRPFRSPGFHSGPREIRGLNDAIFRLELSIVPQLTRDGTFRTNVALLDPRTLSLYTGDGIGRDNSREVSFEIGVPEFYDVTVTWTRLEVHDDSDPHGSGEWFGSVRACSPPSECGTGGAYGGLYEIARWPGGVAGVGLFEHRSHTGPTMDVTDGRSYTLDSSVSLTRVPRANSVGIRTIASDDDGFDAPEDMGWHDITFNPNTWKGWNKRVSLKLNRSTLSYGGLYYSGTVIVFARPSP